MTAAQRATLEQMLGHAELFARNGDLWHQRRADALRAALGTCGSCAHAGETVAFSDGWVFCGAPESTEFPFRHQAMPLGERCTGYTPKEGA